MEKFNIKNVLLGIGIGVVLTSTAGFVYSSSLDTGKSMSDEEIMKKAEGLGMIRESKIFITPTPKQETSPTPVPPTPVPTPTITPTPSPVVEVTITVSPGDTAIAVADKLLEAKLIPDAQAFVSEMINSGNASNIIAKECRIRQGMSTKEIIQILIAR